MIVRSRLQPEWAVAWDRTFQDYLHAYGELQKLVTPALEELAKTERKETAFCRLARPAGADSAPCAFSDPRRPFSLQPSFLPGPWAASRIRFPSCLSRPWPEHFRIGPRGPAGLGQGCRCWFASPSSMKTRN